MKPWILHEVGIYSLNKYFTIFPMLILVLHRSDSYFTEPQCYITYHRTKKKGWLQSSRKKRNGVFFLSYKQHPHTIPYYYASSAPPTYFHPGRWVGVSKFGKCDYSYIQLTELNVWSHSIWSDWNNEKHHSLQFHPKLISKKTLLILSVTVAFCCLVWAGFFVCFGFLIIIIFWVLQG